MKMRRIRVEQLRQFRQPVVLDGLCNGINLFTGPNESGKSTLVRAVRAAFFERYKSVSVDDLQPWGDSSAAPEVELEFEWKGELWRLTKSFLKKKRCDLQVGSRTFSGEEAEEKLADLLGFQYAGRGASKPEHWGVPGLLWIEQGAGQDVQQAVRDAGTHLKSALGGSLGELASSAGDDLIVRLAAERSKFLTNTGRPSGEYKIALEEKSALESNLRVLDEQITQYAQQVDRLAQLRAEQLEDRSKPWLALRSEAEAAREQLRQVESLERDQVRERQALASCRASQELSLQQLDAFAKQADDVRQRRQDHTRAVDIETELRAQGEMFHLSVEQAELAYNRAVDRVRAARQKEYRERLERELHQVLLQLGEKQRHLGEARQLAERIEQLRLELSNIVIEGADLKRLRDLVEKLRHLEIKEQTVATRLEYRLQPGASLQLGPDVLQEQGERVLLEPAILEIPGVGQLRIVPGGEELAELARQRQRYALDIEQAMGVLNVDSLVEAEQRAEDTRRLTADIQRSEDRLGLLAPQGIDALAQTLALFEDQRERLARQLGSLPQVLDTVPSLTLAEAEQEHAQQQLKAAEQTLASYQTKLQLARQASHTAREELQKLEQLLESPATQEKRKRVHEQLRILEDEQRRLEASVAARQLQIDAANPEILRQDIERLSASADALERRAAQRALDIRELEGKLEAMGAQGLEEARAEQTLAFEQLERRCQEFSRRAQALNLLLDLLREKRQVLTRRLQAPLQRHLNRYLQLLFSNARLEVDDDLVPRQLVRTSDTAVGEFEALSFGAREQMGLISRLAYADLLKEAGRPTLIILDDALVHSDSQRLAQMKRVLFDAATRHQIFLFTCHPENWHDLGATPRDLHSLKSASS